VELSTFSKASKIREVDVFEKITTELNKRLSIKKVEEKARALFPIDSTVTTLTSKVLWQEKCNQVKLSCGLNSITSEVEGMVIHFGQGHNSKERRKTIKELLGNKEKHFVLRMKNNITLEMLENGKCKVSAGKEAVEVRVVMFCELEKRTEFRLATDLPWEREGGISNKETVQRWQVELLGQFLKMHLKLDNLITKNENGIRMQIYSCIITYLILQLIDIEEGFGKSLLDKLRYLQSFMCQHTSYVHWFRSIVYAN